MSWSLTIGRFGATTVRVHLTFFLLLAWIGVSAWEKGGLPAARDSVLFIALIFACVVLHEFGHIIMARRFGIETPDVILLSGEWRACRACRRSLRRNSLSRSQDRW